MRKTLAAAIVAAICAGLAAQKPDFEKMIRAFEEASSFEGKDYGATISVTQEKPNEKASKFQIRLYRRDADDATVILIDEPRDKRGDGLLQVGKNVWYYDKNEGDFIKQTASEQFQGTDADNRSFGRFSKLDDYRVSGGSEGMIGKTPVWIIDLEARNREVEYPFEQLYVAKANELPMKAVSFGADRKKVLHVEYYLKYAKVGEKTIASQIKIVDGPDADKDPKAYALTQTLIEVANPKVGRVEDSVFTKEFLKNPKADSLLKWR
jgi:outer membrane lipoprotein-sorting protein